MTAYTNDKEKQEFYLKKNLRLKKVEETDLEAVDKLCREVYFDVGYHNLQLYFKTSPETWTIILNENNEVIIFSSTNRLPNNIDYAYVITVRNDFRGKRLIKPLKPGFLTSAVMASSTNNTISRNLAGKHWLEKRHGLYGLCTRRMIENYAVPKIKGITIERLRPEFLDQLLEYDRKISLIDRRGFVKEWSMPDNRQHGESVLAVDELSGRCLGYGTMRLFSDYHGIQPLYAENDEIARALMIALTKWCLRKDANLYMPLMAKKRAALEFCYKIGLIITGTEMRNCSTKALQYAKALPIEKVYSVHEYYPV